MIDPLTTLAFSIYSSRGVYALLLGSGVSTGAGILTGWGVTLDLARRLAAAEGETPEDVESWYVEKYGQDPNYSALLDNLTQTPSDRNKLLGGYFEPTPEELDEGKKTPSASHRAIADLIREGYVRVVITTNFDRLLETALNDVGIQPVIVSTQEAARGCLPLAHSQCTILKVNGDYRETRFRNTPTELAAYDDDTRRLLDQIFDEYGLVVCGWSVDWDKALEQALLGCPSRRFSTFWCTHGEGASSAAKAVIAQRQAATLPIASADDFFVTLRDSVLALKDASATRHPISAELAVAQLKRHLDSRRNIAARDLILAEIDRAISSSAAADMNEPVARDPAQVKEQLLKRFSFYEGHFEVSTKLLVAATDLVCEDIAKAGVWRLTAFDRQNGGVNLWLGLQLYPVLWVTYAIGVVSVYRNQYSVLDALLRSRLRSPFAKPESVAGGAVQWDILADQNFLKPPNRTTPLSDYLFEKLRPVLSPTIANGIEYEELFDWCEYILALAYLDASVPRDAELHERSAPVGRFLWHWPYNYDDVMTATNQDENGQTPKRVKAMLLHGMFDKSEKRFYELKGALDSWLKGHPRRF